MSKSVLFQVRKNIALITLNRPEGRNMINQEMLINLYNCIDEVGRNHEVKMAILTGNGSAFCSGIDILSRRKEDVFNPRGDGKDLPDVFNACKKPIIGAINGRAITAGLELALNCDFLIGSEKAAFADTHARSKFHPGWGMTQLLQQAVGIRMAKQMTFTGQFIYAEKALQIGLINELVPHDQLIPRCFEIAEDICAVNQEMLGTIKGLMEYRNLVTCNVALAHERIGFKNFLKTYKKK